MVQMTVNQFIKYALAIVLLIALLFVGIEPLKKVYVSFKDFGTPESESLVFEKEQCNKKIDAGEDPKGCALSVAKLSFEEGEAGIIVEKWLQQEVKGTENPLTKKGILIETFEFARDKLYPKSKDYVGAVDTYSLLGEKIEIEGLVDEIQYAAVMATYQIALTVSNPAELAEAISELSAGNKPFLENQIKKAINGEIEDKPLLRSLGGCDIFQETLRAGYDSAHPELPNNPSRVCPQFARDTILTGCYIVGDECTSCAQYKQNEESTDPCSGYKTGLACATNSCLKGSCQWVGSAAFGSCQTAANAQNYWEGLIEITPQSESEEEETTEPTPQPAPTPTPTTPSVTPTPSP